VIFFFSGTSHRCSPSHLVFNEDHPSKNRSEFDQIGASCITVWVSVNRQKTSDSCELLQFCAKVSEYERIDSVDLSQFQSDARSVIHM